MDTITNLFARLKTQDILDHDPSKFEPRPRRAWAVIFFAGIILIITALVAHLYVYLYMRADSSFMPDGNSPGMNDTKLNRKGLAEVIAIFQAKSVQFQDLLASPPKIPDPSLGGDSQVPAPTPAKTSQKSATPQGTVKNVTIPIPAP
jgi:hypothetical protein